MKIAIGADHGGLILKTDLLGRLKGSHEMVDVGAYQCDLADDYPDFARRVAEAVVSGAAERGIIICGSGVGACIAANKFPGVRAAICHDTYSAHQGVEHDNMNVLCLGARVIGLELGAEVANAFLSAHFRDEERFLRRFRKLLAIEQEMLRKQAQR